MVEETTKPSEQPAPTPAPAAPQTVTGIGIAALIVGIVAFLSGWIAIWGVLVGATAVVLSIIALKKSSANKAFGITGLILGGIATITSIIFTIFWVLAFTFAAVGTGAALDASKTITETLSAQDAEVQAQIDAKKDFAKGETATFGEFTVKVNSVNANYTPSESYYQADEGSKYVLVNVTVSNPGDESIDVSSYDLELSADGVAKSKAFVSVDDEFEGGNLAKGAEASGNLVFVVKEDAGDLKLQHETSVFAPKTYKLTTLTYTLAI